MDLLMVPMVVIVLEILESTSRKLAEWLSYFIGAFICSSLDHEIAPAVNMK
jgi:hypothetical protein